MLKLDMIFQQTTNLSNTLPAPQRIGGWSEGWYSDDVPDGGRGKMNSLCIARAALLSNAASIVGQRIRKVGGGSSTGERVYKGVVSQLSDLPQLSVPVTCNGVGVANVRRFHLTGIADALVVEGEFRNSSTFNAAFQTYAATVDQLSLKFRAEDLSSPRAQIASIDAGGHVVFKNEITLAMGNKLKMLRVIGANGRAVSGEFTVFSQADSLHCVLLDWDGGEATGGSARLVAPPIYPLADGSSFVRGAPILRKVGRPSHPFRGRRSKRG